MTFSVERVLERMTGFAEGFASLLKVCKSASENKLYTPSLRVKPPPAFATHYVSCVRVGGCR